MSEETTSLALQAADRLDHLLNALQGIVDGFLEAGVAGTDIGLAPVSASATRLHRLAAEGLEATSELSRHPASSRGVTGFLALERLARFSDVTSKAARIMTSTAHALSELWAQQHSREEDIAERYRQSAMSRARDGIAEAHEVISSQIEGLRQQAAELRGKKFPS